MVGGGGGDGGRETGCDVGGRSSAEMTSAVSRDLPDRHLGPWA